MNISNAFQKIAKKTYKDEQGNAQPFLTPDELKNLSIRKGSINEQERQIMKNHAQITLDMLAKILSPRNLKIFLALPGRTTNALMGWVILWDFRVTKSPLKEN